MIFSENVNQNKGNINAVICVFDLEILFLNHLKWSLVQDNEFLVQENGFLQQENEILVQENGFLQQENENLVQENEILVQESFLYLS